MAPPDEYLISVLEIDTPPLVALEIVTEPISVLEVSQGIQGPMGPAGPSGPSGPPGATGPAGRGIQFQGTWNEYTDYDANDAVSWQGALYISTGLEEVGLAPSDNGGLTVRSGWYLAAKAGDPGPPGPQGPPGDLDIGGIEGGVVPIEHGGTGRTEPILYAEDLRAGEIIIVNHNLGAMDVIVQVRRIETNYLLTPEIQILDENNVSIEFSPARVNSEDSTFRVVVMTGF